MRMSLRRIGRLALVGGIALAGLVQGVAPVQAAAPSERALPGSTLFFAKINNAAGLREALRLSQLGRLWDDPAMKPLRDDLASKFEGANEEAKGDLGVSLEELLELPQGPITLAVLGRQNAKPPVALIASADAGKNEKVMLDVMTKLTQKAEGDGNAKAITETFKGSTLHVLRSTKEEDKDAPPVVWTNQDTVFYFGSDIDAVKEYLANVDGRTDSLAATDSFTRVQQKVGEQAQAVWFADVAQILKLGARVVSENANENGGGGNAQQIEAMLGLTGLSGLKAVGGSLAMNVGRYDTLTKIYVLAPAPVQGLLRIFSMPKARLRPEPWVPESVASYESISWDLDNAYTAINDLANTINPGLLNVLEQQLAGAGGQPLSFQKDVFGPLGDRVTILSDFKKSGTNDDDPTDDQRSLFAVALEDADGFRNTLNRLIALTKANPQKREFQGTTIYDFELPEIPNAQGQAVQIKGPLSVAIAKDTLFIGTQASMMEQALRAGGPGLADSAAFQAVAREFPEQTSTLSYARPEEGLRQLYDMVKSGQFEKAMEQAAMAGGPEVPKFDKVIDKEKLPDFSAISKYLSQGGGYGIMSDDGFLSTGFSLKKVNP